MLHLVAELFRTSKLKQISQQEKKGAILDKRKVGISQRTIWWVANPWGGIASKMN